MVLGKVVCSEFWWNYHPPTTLRKGNVFSCVYLSVCSDLQPYSHRDPRTPLKRCFWACSTLFTWASSKRVIGLQLKGLHVIFAVYRLDHLTSYAGQPHWDSNMFLLTAFHNCSFSCYIWNHHRYFGHLCGKTRWYHNSGKAQWFLYLPRIRHLEPSIFSFLLLAFRRLRFLTQGLPTKTTIICETMEVIH